MIVFFDFSTSRISNEIYVDAVQIRYPLKLRRDVALD